MPINVAQLNVVVGADLQPVATALQALPNMFSAVTQAAAASASAEVGGHAQVTAAINQQTQALANQTQTMVALSGQQVQATERISQTVRRTSDDFGRIGSSGSRSFSLVAQSVQQAGVYLGPLPQMVNTVSVAIDSLNNKASTFSKTAIGVAAGITAIGAAGAAIGGGMVTSNAELQNTIKNLDKDVSGYAETVAKARDIGAEWGYTQADVDRALSHLIPVTANATQALQALQESMNLHRARDRGSLLTTTDVLVSALEGYPRTLRRYGIAVEDYAEKPTVKLANAQKELIKTTQQLDNANINYANAVQRRNEAIAVAALRADSLAKAEQTLTRALEDQQSLMARQAAEDATPRITKETSAVEDLAKARLRLSDIQAIHAAEAAMPQEDKVADATDRLMLAQLRLKEVEDDRSKALVLTNDQMAKFASLSDKVLSSQMLLAQATGGDIAGAQDQLRTAVDNQRKALDEQMKKQKEATEQTAQQLSAQMAVKDATEDLQRTQQEAALQAAGQLPAQIRDQFELRDAINAVADAERNVIIARDTDTAESLQRELAAADARRDAERQVADAVAGVAQAHNDVVIAQIQQASLTRAVEKAQRQVNEAVAAQRQAVKDVAAGVFALTQNQRLLDEIERVRGGEAAARADTWVGKLDHLKAKFMNTLGEWGGGMGKFMTIALPAVLGIQAVKGLLGVGAGSIAAEASVGAAATVESVGLVGGALAVLPIVAATAAGAVVGWGEYMAVNWAVHTEWFHDAAVKVTGFAADIAVKGAGLARQAWDGVSGVARSVFGMFESDGEVAGENLSVGLINGMNKRAQEVYDTVWDIAKNVAATMNIGLGNRSPSKIFEASGNNAMEGLRLGIEKNTGPIRATKAVADAMVNTQFGMNGLGPGNLSTGVPSGMGAYEGSGIVIVHQVTLQVAGSVTTERDLVQKVTDVMISTGQGQGGNLGGGNF